MTLSGPGTAASGEELVMVTRVTNHGPGRRSGIRVLEMPPSGAELLSVRPSQGACSTSSVATCELGSLAPGSEAVIIVTARVTREGDVISSAIASGSSDNGFVNESHCGRHDDPNHPLHAVADVAAAGKRDALQARTQQHGAVDDARCHGWRHDRPLS